MATAVRDANSVPVKLAISNADGSTILATQADPATHHLGTMDGTTGSDLTPEARALTDDNGVTTLLAVSSADGVSLVPLYIDSGTGKLLIQTT